MGKRTNTATWSDKYKRWQINVQKDGLRRSFYSSTPGRNGQREANTKADAWLDENMQAVSDRVEAAYLAYVEECRETMSTVEYKHITSAGRAWIIPNIGKRRLNDLTDGDIQKILDKAAALGRSRKTIQDISGIINRFLKWCRRNKKTIYRPDDVHIPASARYKGKTILQPDDLRILFSTDTTIKARKRVKEPFIHAYRFAVLTGLRPGELRGLEMKDIADDQHIYIRRSVNVHGEVTRGKNENAVRPLVLSDRARAVLLDQLREYPRKRGPVFDLPPQSTFREHWSRFCESNGMTRTTLYELRHTFVSVVKSLPAGEVKPLVGHSQNMDTFGIYGHAITGEDMQTAQKINGLFDKIITQEKPVKK